MPNPTPSTYVKLNYVPDGLLTDLPEEDQEAIKAVVGRPVMLVAYDADTGKAELEFVDDQHDYHTIWVEPAAISSFVPLG